MIIIQMRLDWHVLNLSLRCYVCESQSALQYIKYFLNTYFIYLSFLFGKSPEVLWLNKDNYMLIEDPEWLCPYLNSF